MLPFLVPCDYYLLIDGWLIALPGTFLYILVSLFLFCIVTSVLFSLCKMVVWLVRYVD